MEDAENKLRQVVGDSGKYGRVVSALDAFHASEGLRFFKALVDAEALEQASEARSAALKRIRDEFVLEESVHELGCLRFNTRAQLAGAVSGADMETALFGSVKSQVLSDFRLNALMVNAVMSAVAE